MVDTADLKSAELYILAGSSPVSGTRESASKELVLRTTVQFRKHD